MSREASSQQIGQLAILVAPAPQDLDDLIHRFSFPSAHGGDPIAQIRLVRRSYNHHRRGRRRSISMAFAHGTNSNSFPEARGR